MHLIKTAFITKVNSIPVAWLSEEVRSKFHSDFRIVADFFAAKREKREAEIFKDEREIRHVEAFLNFLQAYTSDRRYEQIRRDLQKRSTEEGEVKMCTVMDLQKRIL